MAAWDGLRIGIGLIISRWFILRCLLMLNDDWQWLIVVMMSWLQWHLTMLMTFNDSQLWVINHRLACSGSNYPSSSMIKVDDIIDSLWSRVSSEPFQALYTVLPKSKPSFSPPINQHFTAIDHQQNHVTWLTLAEPQPGVCARAARPLWQQISPRTGDLSKGSGSPIPVAVHIKFAPLTSY